MNEGKKKSVRAFLVSVGGSPAPILFTLRKHRPAHVWYFCSAGSRSVTGSSGSRTVADEIHAGLDWHPERDLIEVERFEELGPCFKALRQTIPGLLRKWKVAPEEVLVDYTGGTKTMSAALVLAATELFDQFSYVGGNQREKGGLGITLDGKERIFYQTNPWSELAVREVERARDLWADCQFDPAAGILSQVAHRVPHRHRFEAIATLAKALGARHRLDFGAALKLAAPLKGKPGEPGRIAMLYDGRQADGLITLVKETYGICAECNQGAATEGFLRELLDNALRTGAQARFEDAAARLYRAMEMQGQLWLSEKTSGAFKNGKLKPETPVPTALADLEFCQPDVRGELKLSLEQIFKVLDRLGHERANKIVADLALDRKSRWRQATEKRNSSVLAHGVNPIGEEGFETMKALASEFLGFNLRNETHPIASLDHRWFES